MKDLTTAEAHNQINALTRRVTTAEADLAKWKIEFDFESDPKSLDITMVGRNPAPGNRGARKTITLEEMQQYSDDLDVIVRNVSEMYYEFFLKDLIYAQIHDRLITLMKNNLKIVNR